MLSFILPLQFKHVGLSITFLVCYPNVNKNLKAHFYDFAGSCPQTCLNGAHCTDAGVCDCETFQAQGDRCQFVPNTGKEREGICKTWGQYNFETFDGIYFYYPGNCSYIFARDCSQNVPLYTIWVHNSPKCGGSVYTCTRSISMFFSSHDEITVSGYEVRKGGVRLTLPQTIENIFIERLADYILVKTTFGFSLAWDGGTGVYIKLSEDHKGRPCGLCGNFNGNWSDDLIMQHSDSTEDIALFANSWNVQTPEEPICVVTESDYPNPCSDEAAQEAAFLKCQVLQQFPFMSCHETIDPYSYIASCMNDLCKKDDEETYCRAVMEYARACSHSGFPIRDWRDDFPACTEKCEDKFVHRDCISCCPPTCTYEKECLGSNLHCLDGCYCPDGLILNNGSCVAVTSCPCIYHGMAYPAGSMIEQECSMCVCVGGVWNCTEHECPAECSVIGDAHFTTFDGRYYTFLGTCQYILVKGTGKEKFTITVQKTLCEQNYDHACIQSITLVIDEDINKQVTLFRDGEVQYGSNQGFIINGEIEVRNLSSMFVQVKTKFGVRIQFSKGGDRLYIKASSAWRRRTLGLCGTFNGNLRDDFLSPAGMIEGTPQLHANAWKISSACLTPVNIPVVDPCDINIQNVGYAAHCDVINQELFAPCHTYVNPGQYYQLCRFDACKCGSSCLCNALAHYAYICNKHGVTVNFRSQVSFCGVVCLHGMVYHQCTSFCGRTCGSLTSGEVCSDECVEGCNCPEGKYFDESVNFCVGISSCRCYYRGRIFHPGEQTVCFFSLTEGHTCPDGKIYFDCRNPIPGFPSAGVNCEATCANLAMNFTCVPSPPCASGCICPAGMAEHKGKCYVPDSCPCTWKDREYLSGEVISTPCYTCVCRRGLFNCTSYPCPSVCTVYGDRHYYTFDGLEYDYASDCQVYLVKSVDNSNVSVIAQNRKCFDNDIICSKHLVISLGDTDIYFGETSATYRMQNSLYRYEHWKAGFYTVVHFPELEMTILWDKKTTIHVKVGPRWKGKLAGLCGNFDKYTSNDFTTSNNMEVRNPQVFGDSWTIGQCKSSNETARPCEVHQSKFPYAKKECSVLYSDVFAPCRNVIDVTSFVKNCHTDTCNCNLGGDCECLCTSIAAYAHKCCQQGVSVHWRSPNLCPYDCEYYNEGLGEGPYILSSCGNKDIVLGVNVTSKHFFPLPRMSAHGRVLFNFMVTPGLFKDKDLSLSLVSLESAERPNYFLSVNENDTVRLEQWEDNPFFRRKATFFHHQGLWVPGFSAFELHSKKGFFIVLTDMEVKVSKYDNSEEFKLSSSFKIEEVVAAVPYRRMCEWRYEPCANPCVKTYTIKLQILMYCFFTCRVEGCIPYCPNNMILDEVTLKCVYPEDCKYCISRGFFILPRISFDTTKTPTRIYIESLDPCSQYVCINMGWILYNVSSNCHKNVEKPDCGFRGMPVQVNSDSCCPEWECPCQCSVLSELSIITFDGNNIALYNAAPYILVRLPKETIVAHIEKCPPSLMGVLPKKPMTYPIICTSGLCFKKLNVTTANFQVLINRLERKVEVNSIVQPLPFSKKGLCIQDTGAMYVINTPAGINIKWTHVTGIIDIQYGLHSNLSTKTEGLCGICNGDPSDDLKMQNRTIITNKEDIEAFIKSWEIEKSIDVTTRRPIRNCTEDNCTYCLELLNRKAFSPCHRKVSPQDFCEKMWINNTYFLNYECDALSAYVALCNKHNICIRWRTKDYCSLTCPEGKEYQACVQPCAAKTCLNKWYYEESPCSYLREDCVCKKGTILHRTDSELCIPEEKCACTDNAGNPHSPGEVWNSSMKRCCMSKCLENGTIIAIEPDCRKEPVPSCQREGETLISVIEEGECCPKKVCAQLNLLKYNIICINHFQTCKYQCFLFQYQLFFFLQLECDLSACPKSIAPNCSEDQILVEARQEDPCCFSYICVCESCTEPVPVCSEGEILTVDLNTTHQCCPHYICVCDENLCSTPQLQCAADTKLVKKKSLGNCCPYWSCEKQEVCIFQGITVLQPGQSLIQYVDGELCYTVQCLPEKNEKSGFYSMDISVLNCSQQCGANQVYTPSPSQQMCCGTCKNVSCSFYSDNGTLVLYEVGETWISNCTKYECTKTSVGAMILGSSVVCPPFNDSDCLKVCVKKCSKEERICQKVAVRTTIRKSDCFSQSPVTIASCDGKCPSATIFNVNLDSHIRFCKCCRENGVQNLTVPLYCSGNGTEVMYVIQEPLDCSCQWN
uniref:Otogelin-like 2 n=1 Tax=Xenopus tropicalis TaxID=8364 RepID=F7BDM2_XENTR